VDDDRPIPMTATAAAEALGRAPGTIYSWATRYRVRKWRQDGRTLFDYRDLATIDGCIYRGVPVPPTPEERDRLRAQRRRTLAA